MFPKEIEFSNTIYVRLIEEKDESDHLTCNYGMESSFVMSSLYC